MAYEVIVKKLSIIVPVYNVEKYIEQCLSSLDEFYDEDIEIIIINDGSTDQSLDIVLDMNFKNDVRVINQENRGLSAARNKGVELAIGEYISFLDSDDFVTNDYLSCIKNNLNNSDFDILSFGCLTCDENGENISNWGNEVVGDYHSLNTNDIHILERYFLYSQWYAWKLVFKREIFETSKFPEGKRFEDLLTIPEIISKQNKIKFVNDRLVVYRRRTTSITNNVRESDIDDIADYFIGVNLENKRLERIHKIKTYMLLCSIVFKLGDKSKINVLKNISLTLDSKWYGLKAMLYKDFPYLSFYLVKFRNAFTR